MAKTPERGPRIPPPAPCRWGNDWSATVTPTHLVGRAQDIVPNRRAGRPKSTAAVPRALHAGHDARRGSVTASTECRRSGPVVVPLGYTQGKPDGTGNQSVGTITPALVRSGSGPVVVPLGYTQRKPDGTGNQTVWNYWYGDYVHRSCAIRLKDKKISPQRRSFCHPIFLSLSASSKVSRTMARCIEVS